MNATRTAARPLDRLEGVLPADFDPSRMIGFSRGSYRFQLAPEGSTNSDAAVMLVIPATIFSEALAAALVAGARVRAEGLHRPYTIHTFGPNRRTVVRPERLVVIRITVTPPTAAA